MKKRMIAITAFIATVLVGCGQIDEVLNSANDSKEELTAAQIEVQTDIKTDVTTEMSTEKEATATLQQTTSETSTETANSTPAADEQAVEVIESANSENNTPSETKANEEQTSTETEKPVVIPESTTQSETLETAPTDPPIISENSQGSDVFKMLDNLNYQPISCDGLPEYQLTASDGTVYLLNISGGWVWRRPSLISDADNEAVLTREVIDAINANWASLNIVESKW